MGSEGTTSRRRILDYLNDGEELGIDGPAAAAATPRAVAAARSLLPRFRWARMARLGRKGGGSCAGVKVRQPRRQVEVAAEKDALEDCSGVSACATAGSSGGGGETRAADLGVGLGLVFLLAKTSDEFSKMAKVRAEMETLLAEFKGHVVPKPNLASTDAHDVSTRPRNIVSAASSCLTDGNERGVANDRSEDRRRDHQVASCSGVGVVEESSRKRSSEDVLEEEFHAELERLHVHYGPDSPPFLLGDEHDGAEQSDDDDDIAAADCRQGFPEDDDDEDHGHDDEEEEEDDDDDASRYRGVSAVELERRLHELLHQRNQERIEELEAALRRAERRLFEKEMEASLWKDTAKMALRQDRDDDDDELQ
uniref:Uncharacterized protein n=2 Tax=Avena sativa TaxID=4498 RepID=A0ACD5UIR7_AVESA